MMTFKPSHLFVHPSLINRTIMARHYLSFFWTPVLPGKTLYQIIHLLSGQTNSPYLHWHTNKHLLYCTFSNSLTNNYANLTEPFNQGIKLQVTTEDVKKEDKLFMKSPPPTGGVCKECFSNSTPYVWCYLFKKFVNIPGQSQHDWNWTWCNIWNLLTINLKDESYSNVLGENFQIYVVQITEKCICETPPPFA